MLTKREYVVMVVDLEGSTPMKYWEDPATVVEVCLNLFVLVRQETRPTSDWVKFTGDGALAIFRLDPQGAKEALRASEGIMQGIDRLNLRFQYPVIHVRIGIATGLCYEVLDSDLGGRTVDLAFRLCAEADRDSVLVDSTTQSKSGLPDHLFTPCYRRLSLKGVPVLEKHQDVFFHFDVRRFLRASRQEILPNGLVRVYHDRLALLKDFTPCRIMHLAAPDSTILLAGRTLISWTGVAPEMMSVAREKNVSFRMLLGSEATLKNLDKKQQHEIQEDLPIARRFFSDLCEQDPYHFQVNETDQLILDGAVCATLIPPGSERDEKPRLVVLQDVNAAPGLAKATLLLACACDGNKELSCMAHGLQARTQLLYEGAKHIRTSGLDSRALQILRRHDEGLPERRNLPSRYLAYAIPILRTVAENGASQLPPPVCVQINVTSGCPARCEMCHQAHTDELPLTQWKDILQDWSKAGVRSVIVTGGEPLMRKDIAELLRFSKKLGLHVGLVTSGTVDHEDSVRKQEYLEAIIESVDWISVSVEGMPVEDKRIRQFEREGSLSAFCQALAAIRNKLSAAATLQSLNVDMDLRGACRFVTETLRIPRLRFKLVTGSRQTLSAEPSFLPSAQALGQLLWFLWNDSLPQEESNNLSYLRRCFADRVFSVSDAVEGVPVRSFYHNNETRCYTPFLYSMIGSDGSVYPCCYLARENHGADPRSAFYRKRHCLGNVTRAGFQEVWLSSEYHHLRKKLARVESVGDLEFIPCGECTRHVQHNRVLTMLQECYQSEPHSVVRQAKMTEPEQPVWF